MLREISNIFRISTHYVTRFTAAGEGPVTYCGPQEVHGSGTLAQNAALTVTWDMKKECWCLQVT